jgi:hypothetical protein
MGLQPTVLDGGSPATWSFGSTVAFYAIIVGLIGGVWFAAWRYARADQPLDRRLLRKYTRSGAAPPPDGPIGPPPSEPPTD